jgi:adenine-specific DNA glycosylase
LQSLPELAGHGDEAAATTWLRERLACAPVAVSPAPTFAHGFSHFRLLIQPLVLRIGRIGVVMEPRWTWHTASELAGAALPAPVRALLTQILA